ncbi:TPA: inovirus Gp2 family protein [Klebsiella pneumoniae]|nr:inovirus Gp2 family protein [Klebsiella pneumoniae]
MNNCSEHEALKTNSDGNNVMLIRRVLQQATDHYPRLSALGFTLQYANCYSCDNEQQGNAQLLRFHAEAYCRIGDYSKIRIEAGKPSQPTVLRWLWEAESISTCRMMMLFNQAVCSLPRHDSSAMDGIQEVMSLLVAAWREVEPGGELTEIKAHRAERTMPAAFDKRYAELRDAALQMTSPVAFAKSCSTV